MHVPRDELVFIIAVVDPEPWLSGEGKWMDVASNIARKLFAQAPSPEHCMSALFRVVNCRLLDVNPGTLSALTG
jgi:hypothetical protein